MIRLLSVLFLIFFGQQATGQCLDTLNFPNEQPPCYPDFIPVCGCDNVTYRNDCYADYATVLQYSEGPCDQVAIDFYPNPVTELMVATVATKFESDVNVYIFDRNGNIYYDRFLRNVTNMQIYIPVTGFEKGLYFIAAESNGQMDLHKFVRWEL